MGCEQLLVLIENMRKITTTAMLMHFIPESTEMSGLTVSDIGTVLLDSCDEINDLIVELKRSNGWNQEN